MRDALAPFVSRLKRAYAKNSTFASASAMTTAFTLGFRLSDIAHPDPQQTFEDEIIHDLHAGVEERCDERRVASGEQHRGLGLSRVDHITHHALDRAGHRVERTGRDRVARIVREETETTFLEREPRGVRGERAAHERVPRHDE